VDRGSDLKRSRDRTKQKANSKFSSIKLNRLEILFFFSNFGAKIQSISQGNQGGQIRKRSKVKWKGDHEV